MKKLFLVFASIICMISPAFAIVNPDYACNCPKEPYNLSSKACQATSKYTGMTFFAEKIAQLIIKKELKKAVKENFKVQIKSYSPKDLLEGRFKSLKIYGRNLEIDGTYITNFEAKTVCNFNYVELNKNSLKFRENFVMDFAVEISNNDLKKTIKSTDYINMLNKINMSAFGITFFKLDGADVQIKNDKLYLTVNVTSPLSKKPLPILVRTDLKVEDGNIVVTKVDFVNALTMIDLSRLTYLLNALNPLTFSMDILNNKESELKITDVDIVGNKIFVKGSVFVPKNSSKK